jgi:hypothetical protein
MVEEKHAKRSGRRWLGKIQGKKEKKANRKAAIRGRKTREMAFDFDKNKRGPLSM